MTDRPAAFEVADLRVTYGRGAGAVTALDGVTASVAPGEVLAVVGASGGGKSTLCRTVLGLAGPTARVEAETLAVAGRDLRGLRGAAWDDVRGSLVTYIPQQPMTALSPTVPVGRQVAWYLGPDALERYEADLRHLGLDALLDRPSDLPGRFSGGQLQRMVIAIATLGRHPALLVADEPTSTLDAKVAGAVIDLLDERRADLGAGLVYVAHDMARVAQLADRVAVLAGGRVVESGSPDVVLRSPARAATRELLAPLPSTPARSGPPTTTPSSPELEVVNLYRYHGQGGARTVVRAVDDVTFSLPTGTVTALIGESGAGKSTLARVVAGAEAPTAGEVRLAGRSLGAARSRADRRAVQLVTQNHRAALNPARTVAHALVQAQRAQGLGTGRADRREKAGLLLGRVGLDQRYLGRRPRQLSGGEAARVAIARSLLVDPRVLILDEPTAGLDARARASVLGLVAELQAALGLTVLLITHELAVAARAERVLVMQDGRIVEDGDAEAVFSRPQARLTRSLLAADPAGAGRRAPQDLHLHDTSS